MNWEKQRENLIALLNKCHTETEFLNAIELIYDKIEELAIVNKVLNGR